MWERTVGLDRFRPDGSNAVCVMPLALCAGGSDPELRGSEPVGPWGFLGCCSTGQLCARRQHVPGISAPVGGECPARRPGSSLQPLRKDGCVGVTHRMDTLPPRVAARSLAAAPWRSNRSRSGTEGPRRQCRLTACPSFYKASACDHFSITVRGTEPVWFRLFLLSCPGR